LSKPQSDCKIISYYIKNFTAYKMNCSCPDITEDTKKLFESEHIPALLRNEFGNTGYKYGLVIGRNVPVTISVFRYNEEEGTYFLSGTGWSSLTLTFDNDTDTTTTVKTTFQLTLVDQGQFDPDYIPGSGPTVLPNTDLCERYQCVYPESELNKLAVYEWVVGELTADDGEMLSRCVFKVLGGQ
jgi:hypothetical protein